MGDSTPRAAARTSETGSPRRAAVAFKRLKRLFRGPSPARDPQPERAIRHVFIATPAYGGTVTAAYFQSVLRLVTALPGREIEMTHHFRSSSLLPLARNELVADFLEQADATHLLFWDADMGVMPDVLFDMLDFGKPVVGLAYPKKHYDWSHADEPSNRPLPDRLMEVIVSAVEPPERVGKFLKSNRVGTGFLLIERPVFETVAEAMPELAYTHRGRRSHAFFDTAIDPETKDYVSEDYAFCDRVRRCGGEIWCHVEAPVTHVGVHSFEWRGPGSRSSAAAPGAQTRGPES